MARFLLEGNSAPEGGKAYEPVKLSAMLVVAMQDAHE